MRRLLIGLATIVCFYSSAPLLAQQPPPVSTKTLTTGTCSSTVTTGCMVVGTAGQGNLAVQITGTFSGTLAFEGSVDASTYVAVNMTPPNSTTAVTSTTSAGVWSGSVAGLSYFRVRFSSFMSGSAVVSTRTAQASARMFLCDTCTIDATPAGSAGAVQYNDSGAFGGFGSWNGSKLTIADSVYSTFGSGSGPAFTLPAADGMMGECAQTDGSAVLSFGSCGASALAGLSDVTLTSLMAGQPFAYDGSKWINLPGWTWDASALTAADNTPTVSIGSLTGYSTDYFYVDTYVNYSAFTSAGLHAPSTDGLIDSGINAMLLYEPSDDVPNGQGSAVFGQAVIPTTSTKDAGYLYGAELAAWNYGDGDVYEQTGLYTTASVYAASSSNLSNFGGMIATANHDGSGVVAEGFGIDVNLQGSGTFTRASAIFIDPTIATVTATHKWAIFYNDGATSDGYFHVGVDGSVFSKASVTASDFIGPEAHIGGWTWDASALSGPSPSDFSMGDDGELLWNGTTNRLYVSESGQAQVDWENYGRVVITDYDVDFSLAYGALFIQTRLKDIPDNSQAAMAVFAETTANSIESVGFIDTFYGGTTGIAPAGKTIGLLSFVDGYVDAGGPGAITNVRVINLAANGLINADATAITNFSDVYLGQLVRNEGPVVANYYGLYVEDHSGIGSTRSHNIYSAGSGSTNIFEGSVTASDFIVSDGDFMIKSAAAFTDGAGLLTATLTTSPVAGNPTKWIAIDDNGTTRYIPAW